MDKAKIKDLIDLVENSSIAELEVHFFFGKKVVIRKYPPNQNVLQPSIQSINPATTISPPKSTQVSVVEAPALQTTPATEKSKDNLFKIRAPMVGTFYRKPSPESPPYVNVGDTVVQGQVVCLIESMKLFNEVKSEVSGKVVEIPVDDASPVEYGQVILVIEQS